MSNLAPVHPGEVLLEELLQPLEVTQHRLAMSIAVPPQRINEIVHGKRRITADTALRLPRCFGTTDRFWLNRQTRYDLETEKESLGRARWDPPPAQRLTTSKELRADSGMSVRSGEDAHLSVVAPTVELGVAGVERSLQRFCQSEV